MTTISLPTLDTAQRNELAQFIVGRIGRAGNADPGSQACLAVAAAIAQAQSTVQVDLPRREHASGFVRALEACASDCSGVAQSALRQIATSVAAADRSARPNAAPLRHL